MFSWTSAVYTQSAFFFVLFCLLLHSGRHISLNDSHTKTKEQELGRGGLDNEVIASLNNVRRVKGIGLR